MEANLKSSEDKLKAGLQMHFRLQEEESSLDLVVLNAFGTRVAKITLNDHQRIYTDKDGQKNLNSFSLFQTWFHPDWWREVAFIFGKIASSDTAEVWVDTHQHPVKRRTPYRQIQCEYANDDYPTSCEIESQELNGRMNFTSVTCRSTL